MSKKKSGPHDGDELTDHQRDDCVAEVMLAESQAEARAWLRQRGHMMARGENDEAIDLVERFYRAGAANVHVSDIIGESDERYARVLVVTLPAKKDARAAVIQVAADHNFGGVKKPAKPMREFGFFDSGQRFLIINFL